MPCQAQQFKHHNSTLNISTHLWSNKPQWHNWKQLQTSQLLAFTAPERVYKTPPGWTSLKSCVYLVAHDLMLRLPQPVKAKQPQGSQSSLTVWSTLRMDSFHNSFNLFLGTLKHIRAFDFVDWCVLIYVSTCSVSFIRVGFYFVQAPLLVFLMWFCMYSDFRSASYWG